MKKKTLVIHIGWHKTATTVIQSYLSQYRKEQLKYNICYPKIEVKSIYGKIKHCDFLASILNELKLGIKKFDVRPFDTLFDVSLKEVEDSGCNWAIISDEGFSYPDRRVARKMALYKKHFDDIKIIAYIRRQDFFLESFYAQLVKQDNTRTARRFKVFYKLPDVRKRLDYYNTLEWWANEFGSENVLVTPYEKHIVKPDPVSHFFDIAELPTEILKKFPPKQTRINTTPSRELTDFFRYLNLHKVDFRKNVISEFFSSYCESLTDTRYLSLSDRKQVLDDFKDCNEKIARKYLGRENGILFEEPVIDYPNCVETWKGFTPAEALKYAIAMNGLMSIELDRLKKENQRIAGIKKLIYRYFMKSFNKYRGHE